MSDRMPPGRPLGTPPSGWTHGPERPFWLDPAIMLQALVVVYFVFLLWMEYDSWQREEEALATRDAGTVSLDDHDEF